MLAEDLVPQAISSSVNVPGNEGWTVVAGSGGIQHQATSTCNCSNAICPAGSRKYCYVYRFQRRLKVVPDWADQANRRGELEAMKFNNFLVISASLAFGAETIQSELGRMEDSLPK